jgi:hypothetical protein
MLKIMFWSSGIPAILAILFIMMFSPDVFQWRRSIDKANTGISYT